MTDDTYLAMRNQVLALTPGQIGVVPTEQLPTLWAVVVESGLDRGGYTLAVLGDGTTSLYFSSGGGVIGTGGHPAVRETSSMFLGFTQQFTNSPLLVDADSTPLPAKGQVRIYLLTHGCGPKVVEAPQQLLGDGPHPFHQVFIAAHDVIAAVRSTTEPPGAAEYLNFLLTAIAEARIDRPVRIPAAGTPSSLEPFARSERLREWLADLNFDYQRVDAAELCDKLFELGGVSKINPFKKRGTMTVSRITESGGSVKTSFTVERSKGADGGMCVCLRWIRE